MLCHLESHTVKTSMDCIISYRPSCKSSKKVFSASLRDILFSRTISGGMKTASLLLLHDYDFYLNCHRKYVLHYDLIELTSRSHFSQTWVGMRSSSTLVFIFSSGRVIPSVFPCCGFCTDLLPGIRCLDSRITLNLRILKTKHEKKCYDRGE